MVKEIKKDNQNWYQCEVCGHHYADKTWAEQCEEWCSDHDDADPEITQHSLEEK